MAMKVEKSTVHRLSINVSCGCRMYAEFSDPRCKAPFGATPAENPEEKLEAEKTFVPCEKHAADPSLSMLEFMIGERLEEAIEEAGRQPIRVPVVNQDTGEYTGEVEDDGTGQAGVVAVGSDVQRMHVKNLPNPNRTNHRPARAPGVKTMSRSKAEIDKAAGFGQRTAATDGLNVAGTGGDMLADAAPEDERITDITDGVLDFLDPNPKESGLLDEEIV